jgi:hypothetical protein
VGAVAIYSLVAMATRGMTWGVLFRKRAVA